MELTKALGRYPDFIIGEDDPYLLRWFIIPRNRLFNIYLHKFVRSDDDRALHDHPWLFNISILLKGSYVEHTPEGNEIVRKAGDIKGRWGKAPHRIELERKRQWYKPHLYPYHMRKEIPVWTLFITGPKIREWGFYCPNGWRVWYEFVDSKAGGNKTGRGCD